MKKNNVKKLMYSKYTMSPTMMKELLSYKNKKHIKGTNQEFLCKYVNEEIRPFHPCIEVVSH